MKNLTCIICTLIIFSCSFNLKAEDKFEKSINKRNHLLMQYDSINAQFKTKKDSTWFNIRNLALIQSKLIQKDNFIINDLFTIRDKYNSLVPTHEKLTKQLAEKEAQLIKKRNLIKWGIYGTGIVLLLFLVILILFIIKTLKASKLKSQIKKLEVLHVQYQEQLKNTSTQEVNNSKLQEVEAAYNQVIEENKINFENENKSITEKLREAQQGIESLQNNISTLQQENSSLSAQIVSIKDVTESEKSDKVKELQDIIVSKEIEINQLKENLASNQQKTEAQEIKDESPEIELLRNKIHDLERDNELKEVDLIEKHKYEKSKFADEISDLRRLFDEEKLYNQQLKKENEDLNNDIESLKNDLVASKEVVKGDNNEVEKQIDLPHETQVLIAENNSLKHENEEYKKILTEELEFRKEVLKLIEDLKKQ